MTPHLEWHLNNEVCNQVVNLPEEEFLQGNEIRHH